MLVTVLACLELLLDFLRRLLFGQRVVGYRRIDRAPPPPPIYSTAKPVWVRWEVIRLKALMPLAGCRTISMVFNRLFSAKRRMTVGKTFVSDVIRQHRYEIDVVRRQIKNR